MQPRFTIWQAAAVLMVVAVASAAVFQSSPEVSWLLRLLTIGLNLFGLLSIVMCGRSYPFWIGYPLFGCGHAMTVLYEQHIGAGMGLSALLAYRLFGTPFDSAAYRALSNIESIVFSTIGGLLAVWIASRLRGSGDPEATQRSSRPRSDSI